MSADDLGIERVIAQFMLSRKIEGCSEKTLVYYHEQLTPFARYLASQNVHSVTEVTRDHIRAYMAAMSSRRSAGGLHVIFRVLKTFTRWIAREYELTSWPDPMRNLKPPKLGHQPLPPISLDHVQKLLATCDDSFTGQRDRAIILMLLDTGLRAFELLALTLEDVISNTIHVKHGKGGKSRMVFIGEQTRYALNAYSYWRRRRGWVNEPQALWLTERGRPLRMDGLKQIMRRRAEWAGIPMPGIHAFRRAFAVTMLRNGADLRTIQMLLGHSELAVTERYLRLELSDLAEAHKRHGPVNGLLGGR